jgi:hypothetical protein
VQVVDVLNSAIDALEEQLEPGDEAIGLRLQPNHEPHSGVLSIDKRHEFQTILAFQERLSEVRGVARVTLEDSGATGIRFLVEMDTPPH